MKGLKLLLLLAVLILSAVVLWRVEECACKKDNYVRGKETFTDACTQVKAKINTYNQASNNFYNCAQQCRNKYADNHDHTDCASSPLTSQSNTCMDNSPKQYSFQDPGKCDVDYAKCCS